MQSNLSKWATIFVMCLFYFALPANAQTASKEFSDVPIDKPYASAVYQLAESNILGGYDDGTFKPAASITRGQAAAIIANMLDLDTKNVTDPGFKDVSPDLWSYGAISAVTEKGIFRGYADGQFGPNDQITRAQMASILIKAFEFHYYRYDYIDSPFTDIVRLASHQDSVYTLYKLGITSGTSPTTYSPNDPISRAQAAVLITKTESVKSATLTLKASDYDWFIFRGFNDYHNQFLAPEQNEEKIVQVVRNLKASGVLQIVPMKEGTQKFTLFGQKKDVPIEEVEYKKYYLHVSKVEGRFKIDFEETDDIFPTNVRLDVKKDLIENVSLETMDGVTIDEEVEFQICREYTDFNSMCILITEPGEYIATVEYEDGSKVRYGARATLVPSSFYFSTRSIEETPDVMIDLSNYKGDFSVYEVNNENIVNVTREENTDIFHLQGLSEGNTYIDFPNSEYREGSILGLNVSVSKIGSIIRTTVSLSRYEDLFY